MKYSRPGTEGIPGPRLIEDPGVGKVLVVDDEEHIRDILARWLTAEGYECDQVSSASDALQRLNGGGGEYDLLVSDITMPGMDGVELLEAVGERHPDLSVVMVTAVDDRQTAIRTLEAGAFGYVIKPFDRNEILINVANALERRRLVLSSREYERWLEEEVRARTGEVRRREEEIVQRLLSVAATRHEETGDHLRRIGLYAAALGEALEWPAQLVDDLRVAAPMHDVGKVGIPDQILLKPSSLTDDEFAVIKAHPQVGATILGGSDVPLLQMATDIALYHHEAWDGSGYPEGRAAEDIPPAARAVAVVDVYDALIHDRIYRPALPEDEALRIITQEMPHKFDPLMLECFVSLLPEFRAIRKEISRKIA